MKKDKSGKGSRGDQLVLAADEIERVLGGSPRGDVDVLGTSAAVRSREPLELDRVPVVGLEGKLLLMAIPGRSDSGWERDVDVDVQRLQEGGVSVLVSLVEPWEYASTETGPLMVKLTTAGIETVWYPIPDHGAPRNVEVFDAVVRNALGRIAEGVTVAVHCKAGKGRTGLFAACLLVRHGYTAEQAIERVHAAREGTLKNPEQLEFVRTYEVYTYPERSASCGSAASSSASAQGAGDLSQDTVRVLGGAGRGRVKAWEPPAV